MLDKSGRGCGRFNEMKANRITTKRYMYKLINLLNKKWGNKNPPQATQLRLHEGSKACVKLESEK